VHHCFALVVYLVHVLIYSHILFIYYVCTACTTVYILCTLQCIYCVHYSVYTVCTSVYILCTLQCIHCVHYSVYTVYTTVYILCTLQIYEITRKIASRFSISGPLNMQFLVTDDNIMVIELNLPGKSCH